MEYPNVYKYSLEEVSAREEAGAFWDAVPGSRGEVG